MAVVRQLFAVVDGDAVIIVDGDQFLALEGHDHLVDALARGPHQVGDVALDAPLRLYILPLPHHEMVEPAARAFLLNRQAGLVDPFAHLL